MSYNYYTDYNGRNIPYIWTQIEGPGIDDGVKFTGGWLLSPDFFGAINRDLHDFCRRFHLSFDQPRVEKLIELLITLSIYDTLLEADYDLYEVMIEAEWEDIRGEAYDTFVRELPGMDPRIIEEVIVEEFIGMSSKLANELKFVEHFLSLGVEVPLSVMILSTDREYVLGLSIGAVNNVKLIDGMIMYEYGIYIDY